MKQKIQVSEKQKRCIFQKNRYFTPLSALNQIKINRESKAERKQNIMVSCVQGVKSILEAVKSLCLQKNDILCFIKFTLNLFESKEPYRESSVTPPRWSLSYFGDQKRSDLQEGEGG